MATRPSKPSSREASTLELNAMTTAEVEQAALAREHAAFGTPGPAARATLDGDGEPTVRISFPTGPAMPSAEETALHEGSGHVPHRSWSMVHCSASGGKTAFEGTATRNRRSRAKN